MTNSDPTYEAWKRSCFYGRDVYSGYGLRSYLRGMETEMVFDKPYNDKVTPILPTRHGNLSCIPRDIHLGQLRSYLRGMETGG